MLTSAVSKVWQKEVAHSLNKNGQLEYRAKCVKCCVKLGVKMVSALFSEGYGTDLVKK